MITTILLYLAGIIVLYIVVSSLLHYILFPVKFPAFNSYFQPGDILTTYEDGMTQIVESIKDDLAFGNVILEPYAIGPVEHIHKHFD
ncbi:MAG: hypothetical protein ABI729_07355, partial [Chitinophagales bacterium]